MKASTTPAGTPQAGGTQPDATQPGATKGGATKGDATKAGATRSLLDHARPHRKALIAGAALSALGGVSGLAQPLVAKSFVEALAVDGSVTRQVLLLALLIVGGALTSAFGMYAVERAAESVVLGARRRLIARLPRLRVADLDRRPPGDLISRVTADTTLLREAATNNLVDTLIGSVTLIGMLVLMAWLDVVLFLAVLGVVVAIGGCTALVMPRIARASKEAQEALGELGSGLERLLGAIRTVKASGAEQRESAVLDGSARDAWRAGLRAARWGAVAGTSSGLVVQLAFLTVLGLGGARVANGSMSVASLIGFLLYLFYLVGPVAQLASGISGLQVGTAAVRRIHEVLELTPEEGEAELPAARTAREGDTTHEGGAGIVFRDVVFRYREDGRPVLDGAGFEIGPGGLTAVVGPSGTGKSTLFALLERFYDIDSGSISVDGRDLRDWNPAELRRTIGYVEQDAPVLAGTLRDNLMLAAPGASPDELRHVMEQVRLTALVDGLPEGLDTEVGHRGTALSGGQRQRVAIARALLRRPRLLLLDEATSQLDALNESELREVIAGIARTTTVLVIAHRLSTVTGARRILVLEDGRVRASGTHAELLREGGLYARLAATQTLGADRQESAPVAGD
ncbi:ABC transporter ATP-binding protein [Streptomyces sp. Isolate_45]|uniref:ABC transporter ATP-binding protein n=1 Tax=Streptomyces sp. Isolate_45 TaxID=2950111 RepID=UPI0024820122|nr:ABC transporter ATP-binding protein [Streptomyces sp. Isolate_45]MDA5284369.1 ABC transporter ATP-binding protein [Streptomyces sp. Isolate_45]